MRSNTSEIQIGKNNWDSETFPSLKTVSYNFYQDFFCVKKQK